MTTRTPVSWFGGKGRLLGWLLPLLPPHQTYVEGFGGGAALLFAKAPAPVEVYNDLDAGLIGFFRVLREEGPALQRRLALTPYSRAEYWRCVATWREATDPVERAARWYTVARQSFGGQWGNAWRFDATKPGAMTAWLTAIDRLLPAGWARLRTVQVEQRDWRSILTTYDTPGTLFYLDPPYHPETRRLDGGGYTHELTAADHYELVARVLTLRGQVLLSGYIHPAYAPLEAAGWRRIDIAVHCYAVKDASQRRVESVWLNYPPPVATQIALWAQEEVAR